MQWFECILKNRTVVIKTSWNFSILSLFIIYIYATVCCSSFPRTIIFGGAVKKFGYNYIASRPLQQGNRFLWYEGNNYGNDARAGTWVVWYVLHTYYYTTTHAPRCIIYK